jgi:hypothetical protein
MDPTTQLARAAARRPCAWAGTRLGIRAGDTSYCSDRATSSLGAPVPDAQYLAYPAVGLCLLAESWMIAE